MHMLAEEFQTVNGKSVPFAHFGKPTGGNKHKNCKAKNCLLEICYNILKISYLETCPTKSDVAGNLLIPVLVPRY